MSADITATLDSWSATPASNLPTGATAISTNLDDNLRMIQAVTRQIMSSGTIASATTTDLSTTNASAITVSGTVTITALGTLTAGMRKKLTFSGALTLTHNGTSLILPGAANIVTVAGDTCEMISLGSGNWKCLWYQQTSGISVLVGGALGSPSSVGTLPAFTLGGNVTSTGNPSLSLGTGALTAGTFTSSVGNSGIVFNAQNATTGYVYGTISNTGGTVIIGIESSVGGTFIGGSTAYDAIIYGKTGISFTANNGISTQMRLSSAGVLAAGVVSNLTAAPAPVLVATGVATTLFDVTNYTGRGGLLFYIDDGADRGLVGVVYRSNSGNNMVAKLVGYSLATVSMSGNNLQVTQTSGSSVTYTIRISPQTP
jgi:hypothetical protein